MISLGYICVRCFKSLMLTSCGVGYTKRDGRCSDSIVLSPTGVLGCRDSACTVVGFYVGAWCTGFMDWFGNCIGNYFHSLCNTNRVLDAQRCTIIVFPTTNLQVDLQLSPHNIMHQLLYIALHSVLGCSSINDLEEQHQAFNRLRPLTVSADNRIVDDHNNEVLLRGVNITSLGEYWQGHPDFPPTLPTSESDFQEMASRGISVIRLIVHWSRIEPERGQIDQTYLEEIDQMVQMAAQYQICCHRHDQDACSFIFYQ